MVGCGADAIFWQSLSFNANLADIWHLLPICEGFVGLIDRQEEVNVAHLAKYGLHWNLARYRSRIGSSTLHHYNHSEQNSSQFDRKIRALKSTTTVTSHTDMVVIKVLWDEKNKTLGKSLFTCIDLHIL